jgi:hypothetical protein
MNPFHTLPYCFLEAHFNIILYMSLHLPSGPSPWSFSILPLSGLQSFSGTVIEDWWKDLEGSDHVWLKWIYKELLRKGTKNIKSG